MADEFDFTDVKDPEILAMKEKLREMEEEHDKLRKMQADATASNTLQASSDLKTSNSLAATAATAAAIAASSGFPAISTTDLQARDAIDHRSIYVGNVDYSSSPEELQAHFQSCGTINRVTILCDKYTGHPKGYAYIEFASATAVPNALVLNDSLFKGRNITITAKRTNLPGLKASRGRGRGRGGRGAAMTGGHMGMTMAGPMPFRGRGRGMYRGRGRGGFTPY